MSTPGPENPEFVYALTNGYLFSSWTWMARDTEPKVRRHRIISVTKRLTRVDRDPFDPEAWASLCRKVEEHGWWTQTFNPRVIQVHTAKIRRPEGFLTQLRGFGPAIIYSTEADAVAGFHRLKRETTAARPAPSWAEVLGVSPSATDAEIKDAYRRAAKVHHPDAGGDATQFTRIEAAYRRGLVEVGQ